MFKRVVLVVVVALFLVVPSVGAQDTPIPQTLFLTYIPNIQFAPVYVGLEKGYFADAGIELTIEHGDEPIGVDLIAAGQRQFGIISGEQVIAARANQRPVVFVYEWFQQVPIAVVTPADSGIATVEDLRGRRVGVPGRFGATYSGLVALLAAHGMTEADVQLEAIGFNAPEVVCVGGIEAAAVYINNEPLQIQNRVDAGDCGSVTGVTVIPVTDSVQLVSNGLVTNEDTIANQPDLVRAMVGAYDAGLRDAINNPAEAYLLSANYVEGLLPDELRAALEPIAEAQTSWLAENPDADREAIAARNAEALAELKTTLPADVLLQYEVLLATLPLWDGDTIGSTELEAWENTEETLITMGFITAPLEDLSAAFTNDFLPE
jgi:NitT/TauT family transport system substrate-binding protein